MDSKSIGDDGALKFKEMRKVETPAIKRRKLDLYYLYSNAGHCIQALFYIFLRSKKLKAKQAVVNRVSSMLSILDQPLVECTIRPLIHLPFRPGYSLLTTNCRSSKNGLCCLVLLVHNGSSLRKNTRHKISDMCRKTWKMMFHKSPKTLLKRFA
jgi:hypothetical protein